MAGRILMVIISVFLLLGAFSTPILDGIEGWRTDDLTQSFSVVTGAGATTANVTLTSDLFQDDTAKVDSITSNITGESPIATTYTASTNVLLVSALNPSATHTLAVTYNADSDSDVMAALGPFLGVLVIGGLIFMIFMGGRKRS